MMLCQLWLSLSGCTSLEFGCACLPCRLMACHVVIHLDLVRWVKGDFCMQIAQATSSTCIQAWSRQQSLEAGTIRLMTSVTSYDPCNFSSALSCI